MNQLNKPTFAGNKHHSCTRITRQRYSLVTSDQLSLSAVYLTAGKMINCSSLLRSFSRSMLARVAAPIPTGLAGFPADKFNGFITCRLRVGCARWRDRPRDTGSRASCAVDRLRTIRPVTRRLAYAKPTSRWPIICGTSNELDWTIRAGWSTATARRPATYVSAPTDPHPQYFTPVSTVISTFHE